MLLFFKKFSSEPQKWHLNAANVSTVKGSPEEIGFNTSMTYTFVSLCIRNTTEEMDRQMKTLRFV